MIGRSNLGLWVLGWLALFGWSSCSSSGDAGAGAAGGGGAEQDVGGAAGSESDASDGAAGAEPDADSPDGPSPIVDQLSGVTVSTLAGSATPGAQDGTGTIAQFNNPVNVVIGTDGNLVVSDFDNGILRRVTPSGAVTTLTSQSDFQRPFGLAFSPSGLLFAQTDRNTAGEGDTTTGTLWQVDTTTWVATVIKENLGRPRGLVASSDTSLYMTELPTHWMRQMQLPSATGSAVAGLAGQAGFADGTGSDARFNGPYGAALMPNGNVVLADMDNHAIRVVTPAGVTTTLAGDGTAGMIDGDLAAARFSSPRDVAVDAAGMVYVSDNGNHRIRRIDVANSNVRTVAGDGTAGFEDGAGGEARFFGQEGLDVTPNGKTLYVADGNGGEPLPYHRIRRIQLP